MQIETMHRVFQDSLSQLEEQVNTAPPLPPQATCDSKKFAFLRGRCLAPIYGPVLLCLLIFIIYATLYNYKQDPASYFSIPFAHSSTSRLAICLVGGARRFELTGPTILKHVLNVFPEADLFVHSNLDENSFKLGMFRLAPNVAEVRIRSPVVIPETEEQRKVLAGISAPNGIQGLLQYFDLVEGCLDMISTYEKQGNFTYDWILRTRVDGYWMGPLDLRAIKRGSYIVPEGSRYGGLNDRLGIGNRTISKVALSRLSLLHQIASAGFHDLNSESAFHAQLMIYNISAMQLRFPFCILSDRWFEYPPQRWGLPIASIGSRGPLNGAYCRPCIPQCKDKCLEKVGKEWDKGFGWIEWRNGNVELCNGSRPWEEGWEEIFDEVAGKEAADVRRRVKEMKTEECASEMEELKKKAKRWTGPDPITICNLGLSHVQ